MLSMLARVLVAVALLSGCGVGDVVGGDDPLGVERVGSGSGWSLGTVGQQVAFGVTILTNRTDEDAILFSARLQRARVTEGAEPVATFAVNTLDAHGMPAVGAWPADADFRADSLHPVTGYRVTPNSSVQLVVIINVREAGRYEWAGLQVEYVTSGRFYSELAAHEFVACVDQLPDCEIFPLD